MLNPLFNLSSFLIGMFFGLINYSIQKGMNIYGINLYQKILTIDNKDLSIVPKESVSDNEQPTKERRLTIYRANSSFSIELNNYEKSKYTNRKEDELRRSYSREITNEKNIENKIKSYNKNIDNNFKINNDSDENKISFSMNLNYDKRIKEMPFFILSTKFLNFYKRNEGSFYFILIIIIFVWLIAFFTSAQFIYVGKHAIVNKEKYNLNTILDKLSFKDVIIKPFLNFIYVIDIDLVVFMVNWIFFTIYSKGSKSGDIYNFFDNNFWAFFLKCYYSFIVISTPIILNIIYQSETVIKFDLLNLILFSFISLFIILIVVIVFYSLIEIPLKKIFKSFLVKEEIFGDNMDEDNNPDYDNRVINNAIF